MVTPFHLGGPSSGRSWARTRECTPSQPRTRSAETPHQRAVGLAHCAAGRAAPALDLDQAVTQTDMLRAQPLAHRPMQDIEQLRAVHGDLWPAKTGRQPPGLLPDQLTLASVIAQFGRRDASGQELIEQAHLAQSAHGMGQNVDTHAQLLHRVTRFVNRDPTKARTVQSERRREVADAGTDDHDARISRRPRQAVHLPRPVLRNGQARAGARAPVTSAPLRTWRNVHVMIIGSVACLQGEP